MPRMSTPDPSDTRPVGGRPRHALLLACVVSVLGGVLMMSPSLLLLRAPREPSGPSPVAVVPGVDRAAAARGEALFASNCTACHGVTGAGVQGLGKDLLHSDFVARSSDAQLLAFMKVGRDAGDPANTTRVAMPPKGGNPALNDGQLADLVACLRAMQANAGKRR